MTDIPHIPLHYGTRSLSFQGSSTHVFYHRLALVAPIETLEVNAEDKGKAKAVPSSSNCVADLVRQIRTSWSDNAPPRLLAWEEKATEGLSHSGVWLFGLSHDPFDSGELTAPPGSADLSGSFDLASLYTCMHNTYGNCEKCGVIGGISRCPRQPGQNTRLSEIIAGDGTDAFGRMWRSFGNALVEHYAWTEGWMAQRVAKTARSTSHPAPPMAVLGKEHSSGIELEIHISDSEWEEVISIDRDDTTWEHPEESRAGTWQRLWPSTRSAIHVRDLELDQTEVDTVVNRIGDQLGGQSVLSLREEEDWTLLWLREDKNMRDMGGTVGLDERGWYCVWPSRWLTPDALESPRRVSTNGHIGFGSHEQQDDAWTLRSTGSVDNALGLLNSFRNATEPSPERGNTVVGSVEENDSQPHDGLPLLFDTQSWLDFDPALDMASDIADTPGTLGAPTPSGRIDGDHLAPINHDSVDAVSSKILSPTANPTPAAQRDWDMTNSAYEMNQHEDIITENDFNFFDAPHTSMFDAFDAPKEDLFSTDIVNDDTKAVHEHLESPEKPSWTSTNYDLEPPAPPYSLAVLPSEFLVEDQAGETLPEVIKSSFLPLETEDDSDDLFGERDDEFEEQSGKESRDHSPAMDLPHSSLSHIAISNPGNAGDLHCSLEQQLPVMSTSLDTRSPSKLDVTDVLTEQRHQPEERMTWSRWAGSTHVCRPVKRKRNLTDLVDLYGDGLVKDRKDYRKRLFALRQYQSRLRLCQRIDVLESSSSDDSVSDGEDDIVETSPRSSWRDYGFEKTADVTHCVPFQAPQSRTAFGLSDDTWTCPHLVSEVLYSLSPTTTPIDTHPVVAPVYQTMTRQPSFSAKDISHDYRSWLTSVITEDPVLRDWLRGALGEDDPSARDTQSTSISFRLGLCGRSTDLAGDAVKFWKQLGLTPFSGQKDVSTSLFFDPRVISLADAAAWHLELETSYTAHGFGRFVQVDYFSPSEPIIQVNLPDVEDALASTKQLQLGSIPRAIIILIPEIPPSQRVSYIQRIHDQYSRIYPEAANKQNLLQFAFTNQRHDNSTTDRLASSIYHRIRVMHKAGSHNVSESIVSVYSPSFTLRPANDTPASLFAVQWPSPSLNPQDAGRMFHLAYTLTFDHAVIGSLIDELGETWRTLHIPLGTGPNRISESLEKLWRSARAVASGAKVEWRFVIIRHGHCYPEELRYWASLFTRQSGSTLGEAQFVLLQMVQASLLATRSRQLVIDPPPGSASTGLGAVGVPVVHKGAFFCGDTVSGGTKGYDIQHLLSATTTQSTICQTDSELLNDIKASYTHLCHLGHWRWSFKLAEDLPPHIQAIRAAQSIMSSQ